MAFGVPFAGGESLAIIFGAIQGLRMLTLWSSFRVHLALVECLFGDISGLSRFLFFLGGYSLCFGRSH